MDRSRSACSSSLHVQGAEAVEVVHGLIGQVLLAEASGILSRAQLRPLKPLLQGLNIAPLPVRPGGGEEHLLANGEKIVRGIWRRIAIAPDVRRVDQLCAPGILEFKEAVTAT